MKFIAHLALAVLLLAVLTSAQAKDRKDQALYQIIDANDEKMVKDLLAKEKRININAQDVHQRTPLMHATLGGQENAVKALLDLGADSSIGEEMGYTPIHGAGFQGRAEIVRMLAAKGVDVSAKHQDGFTGIQRACWGKDDRHADAVQAFLDAGVKDEEVLACRSPNARTQSVIADYCDEKGLKECGSGGGDL